MTYTPFLISNYATGFDRELQPWLLPNDAFISLLDGYVYRGVTSKRDGYSGYAVGETSTYTESRMVHSLSSVVPDTGVINGTNTIFTWVLTGPISRGSVTITGDNPSQTLMDDGLGLIGGFTGDGTGTIDYTSGAVSISFTNAPAMSSTVLLSYSYFPGLPVMGIMSFYPTDNVRQMIVADTRYVNYYDPATDRLVDLPAGTYNGNNDDFWSWVNYEDSSDPDTYVPRLLFCNGVVGNVIQQYDGMAISDYAPTFASGTTLNARQLFVYKDRLVLFQTIEGGFSFPKRIRISGTGVNCDVFDNTATGAGFIDIPDNTQFFGAAFNRDDLLFFTESSVWVLKSTGNDITPFILQKLDGSRGSTAAFSVITYLNRTMAASPRGLIMSDGYQVDRMDDNLPQFTFNDIDDKYFNRCYSAFMDEDRDVYMMYVSVSSDRPALVPPDASDEILVTNFEEDNFSVYEIPLSCMGNFQETIAKLWQNLTAVNGFPNWDSLGAQYNNWNAFPFTVGSPISIGGGHKGEIWAMNSTEGQDNPQMIRSIVDNNTMPQSVTVTTDWNNYEVGDYIYFTGVGGMTNINNKQGYIIEPIDVNYNTFTVEFGEYIGPLSAYTSGGTASKAFEFSAITKKFNPWVDQDKKIKCGWIYFYVNTTNTYLTKYIDDETDPVPVPAFLTVEVITNNNEAPNFSKPQFTYQIDCTNINNEKGSKKWVKIWINQVGQFLQFRLSNRQAGADIQVHAMMPGIMPIGRLL